MNSTTIENGLFKPRLEQRRRKAAMWRVGFLSATIIGIIALSALLINISNSVLGFAAVEYTVAPDNLAPGGIAELEKLPKEELLSLLEAKLSPGMLARFEHEDPLPEQTQKELYQLLYMFVLEPTAVAQWTLLQSLLERPQILAEAAEKYPEAELIFYNWLTSGFITRPQSSQPMLAGVRTAILGSLWTIAVAILFAFPIGTGAAIYLEEYARRNFINDVIQTNINNLAGVPSIIYGMLGLAIFVRTLETFTSGAAFGMADAEAANGRTILSAGLTLGLLILPLIIINSREAIKAVPSSLRQASLALGATKWQTTWHHVLPSALPGILTGTILSISRAIGETAPLVVIGASTFIKVDPATPFDKFTTLPIQIYQWTARPQDAFRNIAAAAIVVLLVLLILMNTSAVLLRNRYSKRT